MAIKFVLVEIVLVETVLDSGGLPVLYMYSAKQCILIIYPVLSSMLLFYIYQIFTVNEHDTISAEVHIISYYVYPTIMSSIKKITTQYTGDPRLMRISLLQFFKTFQSYLVYAIFG